MATATATITTESLWTRVGMHLKNWGSKIKSVANKAGGFIARGARWVLHTAAVQWVVNKSAFVAGKVWHIAKGPVGWVTASVAALIFAPKAVAVMLLVVLLAVAVMGFFTWRIYKLLKKEGYFDETEETKADEAKVDEAPEPVKVDQGDLEINVSHVNPDALEQPVSAEETIDTRMDLLESYLKLAETTGDAGLFSEVTARMHLITVREGTHTKLKSDATTSVIHRDCKERAVATDPAFAWDKDRMYRSVLSENKRYRDRNRLKETQLVS